MAMNLPSIDDIRTAEAIKESYEYLKDCSTLHLRYLDGNDARLLLDLPCVKAVFIFKCKYGAHIKYVPEQ